MEPPDILFPECEYPATHALDMSQVDLERYEIGKILSREIRKLFRFLTSEMNLDPLFESQYMRVYEVACSLGFTLPSWCPKISSFFQNLSEFLLVRFILKESDGNMQYEYSTNLTNILSDSSREHIHTSCPFHMEDNFTHCFMTMLASLTQSLDSTSTILFQNAVCALLHDIGKGNTRCLMSKKNGYNRVSYPCHCLAGSIILRHMWGDHFSKWFNDVEWDLMCDTILYHMCGYNRDPDVICLTLLAHLPTPLRAQLEQLGRADVRGALPMQSFISQVPCLADDQKSLNELLLKASDVTSFEGLLSGKLFAPMNPPLKGVFIVLMGTSACGKSHTANLIRTTLVEHGVCDDLIHHLQRDKFIINEGARLLGKVSSDTSYSEAYAEITRVHEQDVLQGREGIKPKISAQMRDIANTYLLKGHIVLFDTMQTYFSGGRSSILPPAAGNSLRIYVYPVRTTLLEVADCERHDMTLETQIRASGSFSILHPFSNAMKGSRHQSTNLSQIKVVAAATTPSRVLLSQSPHFQVTVSSSVRTNQSLPNNLLFFLLHKIALCSRFTNLFHTNSLPTAIDSQGYNLSELLDSLEVQFQGSSNENPSRVEQISLMRKWFDENQYTTTLPFYGIYLRVRYCYEIKMGNLDAALILKSKIPIDSLPNDNELSQQSLEDIAAKMKTVEDLTYSCLMIKYKDGINRQWSAPWNIQSRSPICMYIHNHWRVISAMPRGPEVAGDQEHGVTSLQDVDINNEESFSHFAPHYRTIIKSLKGNSHEATKISRIICSSKRDGMCFRVVSLHSETPEGRFWQRAVGFIDDPFIQCFVETSRKYMGGDLLIPASNGTAFLTQPQIQYWMVCALALTYGISHQRLLVAAKECNTPADILRLPIVNQNLPRYRARKCSTTLQSVSSATLVEAFIFDIMDANNSHVQHHLCNKMHTWEAIGGPNRMCAFDLFPHVELACSYSENQCGISYLGYSITTSTGDLEWIPHFEINHPFPEPMYWEMDSVTKCIEALQCLSIVFTGNCDWADYYERYPPANRNRHTLTFDPDPEGFVSYFYMEHFNSHFSYVYCKTKTWMYYVMHKIRLRDIPTILNLPEHIGDAFPSYYQVKSFFGDQGIANIIAMLTQLCEFVISNELRSDIPEKAAKALDRPFQSNEVIFKILLCNSKNIWKQGSVQIASKYFPQFALDDTLASTDRGEEGSFVLKALLMELECYRPNWEENVRREFNYQQISQTRQLSQIAGRLWDFIHSK